jgi:transcriptional regulator with XRE-family HTH domain
MTTKKDAVALLREIGGEPAIGSVLRAVREGEGLSQRAFAKKLKIRDTHLSDIERGTKGVSIERALRFAKVLGLPAKQFLQLALQSMLREAGVRKVRVTVQFAA